MICPKCGTSNNGGAFCSKCGAPLGAADWQGNGSAANMQQQYHQPVPNNTYNGPQQNMAPVVSIGSYIGWSLVAMIPFVGFIIAIIFAVDGKNKNRANYFRAGFIIMLVSIVIILVLTFILMAAGYPLLEEAVGDI